MNKEEVLAKSVKENTVMDERDRNIILHRDAFSGWGVIILGIIIMIVKLCKTQSPADIISLFFIMAASGSLYEAMKTKKRIHMIMAAVFFLLSIYYFYRFCAGLF